MIQVKIFISLITCQTFLSLYSVQIHTEDENCTFQFNRLPSLRVINRHCTNGKSRPAHPTSLRSNFVIRPNIIRMINRSYQFSLPPDSNECPFQMCDSFISMTLFIRNYLFNISWTWMWKDVWDIKKTIDTSGMI